MRLFLATIIRSRDGSVDQDTGLVNCYSEKEDPNISYKRPGCEEYYDLQSYGTTPWSAQGIFQYDSDLYSLIDDVLVKNDTDDYPL